MVTTIALPIVCARYGSVSLLSSYSHHQKVQLNTMHREFVKQRTNEPVSQICALMVFVSMEMLFVANSTPIVLYI